MVGGYQIIDLSKYPMSGSSIIDDKNIYNKLINLTKIPMVRMVFVDGEEGATNFVPFTVIGTITKIDSDITILISLPGVGNFTIFPSDNKVVIALEE